MMMQEEYLKLFAAETSRYNEIVLGAIVPEMLWAPLPHFGRTWLRAAVGAILMYLISGGFWCFYIYYLNPNANIVRQDAIPSKRVMLMHIGASMKAMPLYSALPVVSEYMIENGWTRCFCRINDVGWVAYVGYVVVYLLIVEFSTYWVHRQLHEIKSLYNHLHSVHHIYNKPNTLSPFAGFAFHPVDGILQAAPNVVALFLVPMHFTTHTAILFIQGIWAANIHDCIHGKVWPVMGAGYHTVHHLTYRHNYGLYTIWMDRMFGTLHDPIEYEVKKM